MSLKKLSFALLTASMFSSCISVRINPRGYADLKPQAKEHFIPFHETDITKGMKVGDPMQEITADDIYSTLPKFSKIAIAQTSMTCVVTDYPLAYWQGIEDSLHAHGGRLIVVTQRYDGYEELQKELAKTNISYQVYVLSGKKYSDNRIKSYRSFYDELLKTKSKVADRDQNMNKIIILGKDGFKYFAPSPTMIQYEG